MKVRKKQALLVGASGGLGSATIKLLSTDDASIKQAFNLFSSQTNFLDAVINLLKLILYGTVRSSSNKVEYSNMEIFESAFLERDWVILTSCLKMFLSDQLPMRECLKAGSQPKI